MLRAGEVGEQVIRGASFGDIQLVICAGACPGLYQFLEGYPITTVEGGHLRTDVRVVEGLFVGCAVIGPVVRGAEVSFVEAIAFVVTFLRAGGDEGVGQPFVGAVHVFLAGLAVEAECHPGGMAFVFHRISCSR